MTLKAEPSEAADIAERAQELDTVDARIERAVEEQNREAKFRASHKDSILRVYRGSGEIGSQVGGYVKRLKVDEEEIADIQESWIVNGER